MSSVHDTLLVLPKRMALLWLLCPIVRSVVSVNTMVVHIGMIVSGILGGLVALGVGLVPWWLYEKKIIKNYHPSRRNQLGWTCYNLIVGIGGAFLLIYWSVPFLYKFLALLLAKGFFLSDLTVDIVVGVLLLGSLGVLLNFLKCWKRVRTRKLASPVS